MVPNIAILSSGDKALSQTYTICNIQYIYNQHLIISKLNVIQTVFNSYPSHLQFLYFVLLHLQTLFRSFTLTIFIPFFHTNNLYSVCSHLQSLFRSFSLAIPLFHYFTLTIFIPFFHLQSLFRSFTLAIPLFHTCNLYFIHTMHHNTLSNLLWIVGSWTYILYTDELNQWPEAYDTWQQIRLFSVLVAIWSHKDFASLKSCRIINKHIRIVMIFISHTVNVIISLPLTSTQNTMHKIHPVTYFQTLLKLFITKYVYSLKHINTKARYCFIWQDLIGNKSLAFTSIRHDLLMSFIMTSSATTLIMKQIVHYKKALYYWTHMSILSEHHVEFLWHYWYIPTHTSGLHVRHPIQSLSKIIVLKPEIK